MKGTRLVAFVLLMLLMLGSSIALAAQEEGGPQDAGSPSLDAEGLPDRTAYSETASLPSGQLETRIYPEPINYRDEEGNWRPIGERLHETDAQTLTNGPNDFDVTLPKQIDSKPVRFEVGGQWVESQLLRKDLEGVELEGAIATYEGEGNAPSFEFTGLSNGLKEEIELSSAGQANSFTYELSASDSLVPSLADDGSVRFEDSEGTAVVVLPAPVMTDSAGAESRAVHYGLGPEEDGRWKLSVVADREWLEDPARAFPVRIDPTMSVATALNCTIGGKKGETGWIDCAAWGRKDLLIGYTPKINSAEDGWWRSLIEFETDAVPANSEISSATFNIRSLEVAQNTKGVELRKTTKPWTWEASWSRYDGPTHLWTTEGGDYSEGLGEVLTATRGTQIGWWQFNLPTSIVEKEVNAEEWMQTILKLVDDKVRECGKESCTQRKVDFDSSAATTVANRPYLSVVYKTPAPIVTAEAATSVTETGATLKGQVNPHGYATTYQFEYGLTTSYGTKVPVSAESVGSGKANVAVSKAISGLKSGTTYHYRVSATNAYGTTSSLDSAFTTPVLPSVVTESVLPYAPTYVAALGKVNPNGSSTTYQFEFGPTTAYGSKAPAKPETAGAGTALVGVVAFLEGLNPGGSYHYRLTATSAAGTAYGADKVFTTINPPETAITSPMDTYLEEEGTSVQFASDQTGSTFKCSLDEGEVPKKTCSSPFALPAHLGSGWHTFLVAATNKKGESDATPAKYVFNPAIYAPAPATSKLVYPEDGKKTASYYTLKAEWGSAPSGGGVTDVTFQMKLPSVNWKWSTFKDVPEECVRDGEGDQVSWPLKATSNPGHTEPVFLKVRDCAAFSAIGYPEEEIEFRAVFNGGKNAAGASEPATTEFVRKQNGTRVPTDATASVGPATVDLLTGAMTISRTDVSIPVPGSEANLEFTRVYNSSRPSDETGSMGWWLPSAPVEQEDEGSAWQGLSEQVIPASPPVYDKECWNEEGEPASCGTSCPPESCEEWMIEEAQPEERWMELLDNEGAAVTFEISGGSYIAPDYAKELTLTREDATHITLSDSSGTHTTFASEGGNTYIPKTISFQASPGSARLVYENVQFVGLRLTRMIGPSQSGIECGDTNSIEKAGCRTLAFEYLPAKTWSPEIAWQSWVKRLASIRYYNGTGQTSTSQVVAQYNYGKSLELLEEWDPRLPNLKEKYTYHSPGSNNLLTTLRPPGEEPWEFDYEFGVYPKPSRLTSVSRASLIESESTATTTLAYEVPLSGEEAPYELGPEAVAQWDQSDYPVDATAIFPPTEVPDEPPSDYAQAIIHYMDPDGYEVNTAFPAAPGVEGDRIFTSETDAHGNIVRALSPRNRLVALGDGDPLGRSHELDRHAVFSSDGTKMLESWGPLHQVRLEDGKAVDARSHTMVEYDKNAPALKEGESAPRLPTKETVAAFVPSEQKDVEPRVTETEYYWSLRKPKLVIADPKSLDPNGLDLRTRTVYDEKTGLLLESSLPAEPAGGDAHSTVTRYYAAASNPGCESKAWAGLACEVKPAKQPGTAGQPELLVSKITGYSSLDQPTEAIESPGGGASEQRKTFTTYDGAGRPVSKRQAGGGKELPTTKTVYSATTGRQVAQRFVCPAEKACWSGSMSYSSSFGSQGTGKGQFEVPGGIELDAEGDIWVVDAINRRIEEFNDAGEPLRSFGSYGWGQGQFSYPTDLAIDGDGDLWVVDASNNRVTEFSPTGEYKSEFGTTGTGDGQFRSPMGIALAPDGNIWVADTENNRLQVFTQSGKFIRKMGNSGGSKPSDLAEPTGIDFGFPPKGNNTVYVADRGKDRVAILSTEGAYIGQLGKTGTGDGEFKQPSAVSTDSSGNIWVVDRGNNRIERFESLTYVEKFGSAGSGSGQFNFLGPSGIADTGEGEMWITDTGNNRIEKWSSAKPFDNQATLTTYDRLGRPVAYRDADGNVSKTSYDLLGRPSSVSDGKGTQAFDYDETSGLLVAMEDSAAGVFTATYDADGNLVEQGLPNGVIASSTYDETDEPSRLSYMKTGCSEKCTWLDEKVERTIRGQIVSRTNLTSSQQYAYDKVGRLTLVKDTTLGSGCTTRQYFFDKDSNRTKLTTRAPGVGGVCDTSSEGTSQTYSYDAADRLIGEGMAYDSFGRITSLPGKYAGGSALTSSFYSNEIPAKQSQEGLTNEYELDAGGRMREQVQSGTSSGSEVLHYADGADAPAWTAKGSAWTRYIDGIDGSLAAVQQSGGEIGLQLSNLHGDVVATASLSSSAKAPTATFAFDEFGNPKQASSPRYGWHGAQHRPAEFPSGVIQMGVRSYVPAIGRFLSLDPVTGGSANSYECSFADPINNSDVSGMASRKKMARRARDFRRLVKIKNQAKKQMTRVAKGSANSVESTKRLRAVAHKAFKKARDEFKRNPGWGGVCQRAFKKMRLETSGLRPLESFHAALDACANNVQPVFKKEEEQEGEELRREEEERIKSEFPGFT